MAQPVDTVWGLHEFVAENPDEVSFKVGETVRVVQKDDVYNDGWWEVSSREGRGWRRLRACAQPISSLYHPSTSQGTNEAGETGLFPYSYTTPDRELAVNAKALALSAGQDPTGVGAAGAAKPGVMNSTMADVDQALTELQRNGNGADDSVVRQSFQSERTADLSADEATLDEGAQYQARTGARATLAANAKANTELQMQREREEQQRMRAQAQRMFEEEEARQREMLLKKEAERKEAAAKGQLPTDSGKPKVAPIEGVDMSDESDSEGSAAGLDDYPAVAPQTHSPLFSQQQQQQQPKSIDPTPLSTAGAEKDELDDVPSSKQQADSQLLAAEPALPAGSATSARSLSPIASASGHEESRSSLGNAAVVAPIATSPVPGPAASIVAPRASASSHRPSVDSQPSRQAADQRSLASSAQHAAPSLADTSSLAGATGTGTGTGTHTAPTSIGGRETPKSTTGLASATSPAPSVNNRPPPPPGDPRDWTVDQVVEWARGRGWDENTVVSKFSEHEISGDVLLEMDINILKEIDISAFGKRFQVANAIKELKFGAGVGQSPASPAAGTVRSDERAPSDYYRSSEFQPAAAASSAAAAAAGGAYLSQDYQGLGLGSPSSRGPATMDEPGFGGERVTSFDRGTMITKDVPGAPRSREVTGDSLPLSQTAAESPFRSGESASYGHQKSLSAMADEALIKRASNNVSPSPVAAAGSPRKRESGGRPTGHGERASFFAGLNNRMRRNQHSSAGLPPPSPVDDDGRQGKGTFSKLGLNRLKASNSANGGDFKNQISLPTSSPTYDSMGDTARRNRTSQLSNGSQPMGTALGGYTAAVGADADPSGSAGDGSGNNFAAAQASGDGHTPVLNRVRPLDLEGWMRKKGERYNVWKPRYLALKGDDLVVLRDPQAAKIKGAIKMKGYKVIADENTNPGKYGFKILHETEKPHYFSSDDPILVREWMKGLMKATIGRDHSFPVISSYNNATISLKEAQKMNPPPRPPSPTSRARTQRARARENPGELTAKDAAVLMGISSPTKTNATAQGNGSAAGQQRGL